MVKTYPVPCSREEMDALMSAASSDAYWYTLFYVAKTTGRRLGEILEVTVKDVCFEKGIMITQVLKRKRRVEKEAILTEEAVKLLRKHIRINKLKLDDKVFGAKGYRTVQYAVTRFARKAEIKHKVSFHNFRHYFITELVRKGWTWDRIAKLTGHSNPSTLMNYDHAVASDLKDEALEALKDM